MCCVYILPENFRKGFSPRKDYFLNRLECIFREFARNEFLLEATLKISRILERTIVVDFYTS